MARARREADKTLMRRLAPVLALLLLVGSVCDASAHASLASAEPRDGAVVAKAPKKVELHFNESVTAGAVNLIDATGRLRGDTIGGVFFVNWIARERAAARLIRATLVIGIISAAASLGFQGLDVLGLPLSGIFAVAPWKIALGTSLGPSLLIAIAALVVSFVALRSNVTTMSRALSALALAGVGLSLAASGHASTAPPEGLTRPAVFLHGIGVAFWLGALAPLVATLWAAHHAALPIVHRFSRIAVP